MDKRIKNKVRVKYDKSSVALFSHNNVLMMKMMIYSKKE